MEVNLVFEGAKFMLLGMSAVLMFLVLMIFLMTYMSKIVQRYFPEPQGVATAETGSTQKADNKKKVAAIAAAIMHHKKN